MQFDNQREFRMGNGLQLIPKCGRLTGFDVNFNV